MTMMATKVKLAVGAPPVVMTVTECVEVEGNYGPQARITGIQEGVADAVTLYEKMDAVVRQLQRCGLTLTGAVGQRLSFWKEDAQNKAGQTFPALRIDAGGGGSVAMPAPKANGTTKQPISLGQVPWEPQETGAPPEPTQDPFTALTALHARCLKAASVNLSNARIDTLNGDIAGAVTAAGATLFIAARQAGVK